MSTLSNTEQSALAAPSGSGAELIAAERRRQIEKEGWDAANDDANDRREMSRAAAVYIESAGLSLVCQKYGGDAQPAIAALVEEWPRQWDPKWFKSTTPIRDLVKAGALIAAEIDRLQRLTPQGS